MSLHHSGPSQFDSIAALFPAFDFEGLIARGATGAVYKARQRSLDRDVAIRIASPEKAENPAFRNSFKAMAKSMASLGHPGLIRVYDSGEADGLPFVVMEYVAGKTLRDSAHGKAVDPRQAVQIVIAACQGLAHAHGEGIAHGSIRPANILLTQDCEPKIGNFGFTRQCPHHGADAAAYIAPELSDDRGAASPRTDVFSIGMVLQELLTGIPAATMTATRATHPDPKLAAICQKAAHPDPALRYPNAESLAESLGQWLIASRTLLRTPLRAPIRRQPVPCRPKGPVVSRPPTVSRPASRAGRSLMMNCAVIGCLLLAIQGLRGVDQEKLETFARLLKMEPANFRPIPAKAQPAKEAPEAIAPSMVQFRPLSSQARVSPSAPAWR